MSAGPDFEELVAAATAAPSSHNTQPWRFEELETGVAVRADRTRALPVNDPFDRELTISCGAAVFNIETYGSHCGYDPVVEVRPDPDDSDVLARITFEESPGDRGPGDLHDAIPIRRTTRDPFDEATLPDELPSRLEAAAGEHAAHLDFVGAKSRAELATLVAQGDRTQFADPHWRRELAGWMHPRRKGDGLVVPEITGLVTRAVVRAVDVGRSVAKQDAVLVADAPVVAILSTDHDEPAAWLEAGRALEHLLLVAAEEGLIAGYLNQPCQVAELRPRLGQLLPPARCPQIVLRFGKLADTPRPSPRRAVADVVVGGAGG